MTVPDFQSYMTPMLQLLSDGQARHINDISDALAQHLHLTEHDLGEMVPSGRKSRHVDRVGWAATYMRQAELLTKPSRGWYQLSERGYVVVNSGETVDSAFLTRFPEFQSFKARTRGPSDDNRDLSFILESAEEILTPDEVIEASYLTLRNTLAQALIDRLKEGSPRFFEQVVIRSAVSHGLWRFAA